MTEAEHTEYMNLMNLWNCSEPMTAAQIARMEELDARPRPICEQNTNGKLCGNPARVAWTMCGETKLLCTAHTALICRSVGSFMELQMPETASNREGGGGGGSENLPPAEEKYNEPS